MAGERDPLTTWARRLAPYDDEALAALASLGLVRRARKDLEAGSAIEVIEVSDDALRLKLADATVRLREPIQQSECSCPATSTCRHVLAAIIYAKENTLGNANLLSGSCKNANQEIGVPGGALAEIDALTDEELAQYGGRPMLRKAYKVVSEGMVGKLRDVTAGEAAVFEFDFWNVAVRWVPGGGIAGALCSCHARGACVHRIAAVLSRRAQVGKLVIEEKDRTPGEAAGAVRDRAETISAIRELVREMVALGLSRLSNNTRQRLRSIAVSAHTVNLPRLERLLQTLEGEIGLLLERNAQADTRRLIDTASRIEALLDALKHPFPELIGEHRAQYLPVRRVEIFGMGARRWKTPSGYHGLTIFFWEPHTRQWLTWTDARPVSGQPFDPAARYDGEGPWTGCSSPNQASRQRIVLTNAWRSRSGRLSGRESTTAAMLGPSATADVPAIKNWGEVAGIARKLYGGGLTAWQALGGILLLAPAGWGTRRYDAIRQELVWVLFDKEGAVLPIVMPNRPENERGIRELEGFKPGDGDRVLAQLRLREGELEVEPIALHAAGGIFNITLDRRRDEKEKKHGARKKAKEPEEIVSEEVDEDFGEEPESIATASRLGVLIATAQAEMVAIAEAGVASPRRDATLLNCAERMEAIGLNVVAKGIRGLLAELERLRQSAGNDPRTVAGALMRAWRLAQLTASQEGVYRAARGMGRE